MSREPVVDPRHVEFNRWFNVLFPDQSPDTRFKLVGAMASTWNASLAAAADRFFEMAKDDGWEKQLTPDQVADILLRLMVTSDANIN